MVHIIIVIIKIVHHQNDISSRQTIYYNSMQIQLMTVAISSMSNT